MVCHRRAGKTVATINHLIRAAVMDGRPDARYGYVSPFYAQSKDVAWDYLKRFTDPIDGVRTHESELRVDLPHGPRIRLYGADNYDRMRGVFFDGVVLDEFGDMDPEAWSKVIRPALSDRKGWATFIGTPKGHNAFYDVWKAAQGDPDWFTMMLRGSETGILDAAELADAKRAMGEEQYRQEYECDFQAAIQGSYYGALIREAEESGRICSVPYETAKPVETWWDLGVGDSTAIWFVQRVNLELRIIDYYETTGEGLPHYAKVLRDKPYIYSKHVAPHDIEVRELGTGKSRRTMAYELGIGFDVIPQHSVDDGIQAVRTLLPKCWFDARKCERGIEALRQYRKDWDEKNKTFKTKPLHDWTSHAADAFRYGASQADMVEFAPPKRYEKRRKANTGWLAA